MVVGRARYSARAGLAAAALACVIVWQLSGYIGCLASVVYAYAWWGTHSPPIYAYNDAKLTGLGANATLPVPKILHQSWKTRDVPAKWKAAQKSCMDLHSDWEYKLWTDEDNLELIQNEYPWFLPTYLSYPYGIQRADAARYFILHRFGGVYLDLDVGCKSRLDFMRRHQFTAPLTYPVGISNDILAGAPGSTFSARAIRGLQRWNKWMVIKYAQVMFSTGPMYLTVSYASWRSKLDLAAIPRDVYAKYFKNSPKAAFYHLHGSSWHADDAAFVFWLDRHRPLVVAALVVFALAGCLAAWHQSRVAERWPRLRPRRYMLLSTRGAAARAKDEVV